MMLNVGLSCACVTALFAFSLPAATWYVDATGGDDAATGATAAEARRTLAGAMAIATLDDGDVVVLLPGVYAEGTMTYGTETLKTRAVVTKDITIKSLLGRATRDETVITGVKGATDAASVRGLAVAANVTLEGLTFSNCWAFAAGNDVLASRGGAANVYDGKSLAAVDCRFVRCGARSGGAFSSGMSADLGSATAVRCLFEKCSGTYGAAVRDASCFFCLFTGSSGVTGSGAVHGTADFRVVNCTFYDADKMAYSANTATPFLNCVSIQTTAINAATVASNCVFTVAPAAKCVECPEKVSWNAVFMAPQAGDFRPRTTSAAATAGKAAFLDEIPAAYRNKDFAGETVVVADGKVCAGCLTHAIEKVGGSISFGASDQFIVNGEDVYGTYASFYTDDLDRAFRFKTKGAYGEYFCVTNKTGDVTYPDREGYYSVMVPSSGTLTLAPVPSATTLTVAQDGSGDFTTIQDAVDAASTRSVIFVKPGTYATGGKNLGGADASRVAIPADKELLIVSTGGASQTAIVGAAASEPEGTADSKEMGLGAGAVRCVAVLGANSIIDGFTLRDGHTAWTDSYSSDTSSAYCGGGVCAKGLGCLVRNCVITDCAAIRGGGAYCGTYRNCKITGCAAAYLSSVAMQDKATSGKLDLIDCVFDNCWGSWRTVYYYNTIKGCTFGPGLHSASKTGFGVILGNSGYAPVDSLFLGQGQTESALTPVNCAAVSSFMWKDGSDTNGCITVTSADWEASTLKLVGRTSAANPATGRGIGCCGEDWSLAVTSACGVKTEKLAFDVSAADVVSHAEGVKVLGGTISSGAYAGSTRALPVDVCGNGVVVVRRNGKVEALVDQLAVTDVVLKRGNTYALAYYRAGSDPTPGYVLSGSVMKCGMALIYR